MLFDYRLKAGATLVNFFRKSLIKLQRIVRKLLTIFDQKSSSLVTKLSSSERENGRK